MSDIVVDSSVVAKWVVPERTLHRRNQWLASIGIKLGVPMSNRVKEWLVVIAIAAVVTPCVSCFMWSAFVPRVTNADTFRIEKGMTKDEVKAILGPPNHMESGGKLWAYYTYEGGLLAPLQPMYISFDDEGEVDARFS